MNDLATLARLIENLIRLGTVAEVQLSPPRVRVNTGALTTTWLPWIALRAGADKDWNPPTVDEQVLLFSPSGQLGNGIVLAGIFSDQNPANGNRLGLHRRTYPDGTVIEYDSAAHHLQAVLVDGATSSLVSTGGIRFVGPIIHEGDYTQQGNYTQTGDQSVTGKINASADVVAAGISLVNHLHGGVTPGDGQTGAPQ
ncbi:phage baseplate assembly protein V [Pseudomonas sp. NPDC098747]|uniref:phage baseplate assembly protein V n=1 Tax=Pseudomonas sp. NPDC098747 TaxID=3364487 RepID=UPI00383B74D1